MTFEQTHSEWWLYNGIHDLIFRSMQSALPLFYPSKLLNPYIIHIPIFPDVCHGVDDFKDPFPRVKTQVESQTSLIHLWRLLMMLKLPSIVFSENSCVFSNVVVYNHHLGMTFVSIVFPIILCKSLPQPLLAWVEAAGPKSLPFWKRFW